MALLLARFSRPARAALMSPGPGGVTPPLPPSLLRICPHPRLLVRQRSSGGPSWPRHPPTAGPGRRRRPARQAQQEQQQENEWWLSPSNPATPGPLPASSPSRSHTRRACSGSGATAAPRDQPARAQRAHPAAPTSETARAREAALAGRERGMTGKPTTRSQPDSVDKLAKAGKPGKPGKPGKAGKPGKVGKAGKTGKAGKPSQMKRHSTPRPSPTSLRINREIIRVGNSSEHSSLAGDELLDIWVRHGKHFNDVNCATLMSRLGRISSSSAAAVAKPRKGSSGVGGGSGGGGGYCEASEKSNSRRKTRRPRNVSNLETRLWLQGDPRFRDFIQVLMRRLRDSAAETEAERLPAARDRGAAAVPIHGGGKERFGVRACANIAHGVATIYRGVPGALADGTGGDCDQGAGRDIEGGTQQRLSVDSDHHAAAGAAARDLLDAVAGFSESIMSDASWQDIGVVLWAFGALGVEDDRLLGAANRHIPLRLRLEESGGRDEDSSVGGSGGGTSGGGGGNSSQALAMASWAWATLPSGASERYPDALAAVAQAAPRIALEASPQALATLAWSFAVVANRLQPVLLRLQRSTAALQEGGVADEDGTQGLEAHLHRRLTDLASRIPGVFTAIAGQSARLAAEGKAQTLSMTAWAFSSALSGSGSPSAAPSAINIGSGEDGPDVNNKRYAELFEAIAKQAPRLAREGDEQGLSNTAYAFATAPPCCRARDHRELFGEIAKQGRRIARKGNSQALSNVAYAFATAANSNSNGGSRSIGKLDDAGRGPTNSVRAFNSTSDTSPPPDWMPGTAALFGSIASQSERFATEARAQELANLCWSFATLGISAPALFEAVSHQGVRIAQQGDEQVISNTVWAFAKHGAVGHSNAGGGGGGDRRGEYGHSGGSGGSGHSGIESVGDGAEVGNRDLGQGVAGGAFIGDGLGTSMTVNAGHHYLQQQARPPHRRHPSHQQHPHQRRRGDWALTKGARRMARPLFEAVGAEHKRLTSGGTTQGLSNTAWAYATTGFDHPALFRALEAQAPRIAEEGNPQDIANLCWAFAALSIPAPDLYAAVARPATVQRLVREARPQALSSCLWSLAAQGELVTHKEAVADLWAALLDRTTTVPATLAEVGGSSSSSSNSSENRGRAGGAEAGQSSGERGIDRAEDGEEVDSEVGSDGKMFVAGRAHSTLSEWWIADRASATQLVQVALAADLEARGKLQLDLPADMAVETPVWPSRTQRQVSNYLRGLGWDHTEEVTLGLGLARGSIWSLDMACTQSRVAVEFNGPTHYVQTLRSPPAIPSPPGDRAGDELDDRESQMPLATGDIGLPLAAAGDNKQLLARTHRLLGPNAWEVSPGPAQRASMLRSTLRENGATLFKRRLLDLLGWDVVSIPYHEWEPVARDPPARGAFLRAKMAQVGVTLD